MNYVSTRDIAITALNLRMFLSKALADDGGSIYSRNRYTNIQSLKKICLNLKTSSYTELAKKIIYPFIDNFTSERKRFE